MPEQVAADVAGDMDEGGVADPAGNAPQQIVGGDQGNQQGKDVPDGDRGARRSR